MEQLFLVYCILTYFNLEFFNEPQSSALICFEPHNILSLFSDFKLKRTI